MSDRIADLLAEVAELRRAEVRKCAPFEEPACTTRARNVYADAVRLVGGESVVAQSEGVHRTTVLRRQQNPNIAVHLAHVFAMPPEARRFVARELNISADEEDRVRRAG